MLLDVTEVYFRFGVYKLAPMFRPFSYFTSYMSLSMIYGSLVICSYCIPNYFHNIQNNHRLLLYFDI